MVDPNLTSATRIAHAHRTFSFACRRSVGGQRGYGCSPEHHAYRNPAFYGATVTIEEGVRVFRPLPPDRRVIINPDGQAPVSLGFNETNVYERRVVKNYNYNQNSGPAPRYTTGGFWGGGPFWNGYRGGHHDHVGGHSGGGNFGGGYGGGGHGGGGRGGH